MENINEHIRGALILYPAVAVALCQYFIKTDLRRLVLAIILGLALWTIQFMTMPVESSPWLPQLYFSVVIVTALTCFFLNRIQCRLIERK